MTRLIKKSFIILLINISSRGRNLLQHMTMRERKMALMGLLNGFDRSKETRVLIKGKIREEEKWKNCHPLPFYKILYVRQKLEEKSHDGFCTISSLPKYRLVYLKVLLDVHRDLKPCQWVERY